MCEWVNVKVEVKREVRGKLREVKREVRRKLREVKGS